MDYIEGNKVVVILRNGTQIHVIDEFWQESIYKDIRNENLFINFPYGDEDSSVLININEIISISNMKVEDEGNAEEVRAYYWE